MVPRYHLKQLCISNTGQLSPVRALNPADYGTHSAAVFNSRRNNDSPGMVAYCCARKHQCVCVVRAALPCPCAATHVPVATWFEGHCKTGPRPRVFRTMGYITLWPTDTSGRISKIRVPECVAHDMQPSLPASSSASAPALLPLPLFSTATFAAAKVVLS